MQDIRINRNVERVETSLSNIGLMASKMRKASSASLLAYLKHDMEQLFYLVAALSTKH